VIDAVPDRQTPPDTAAELEALITEVRRLQPSWQRPEVFHEQKSEVLARLRTLASSPLLVRRVVKIVPASAPSLPLVATPRRRTRPRRHAVPGQLDLLKPPPADQGA
jgi:hypothetical protein